MAKKISLVDLLKLQICSECPSSIKVYNKTKLICNWDGNENKTACLKVEGCGNWPEYFANEIFCSITLLKPG